MSKDTGNSYAMLQRALRIIELLAGRYYVGASGKELADLLETTPSTITRDMQALETMGWAKKLDTGLWTLTPKPMQIMQAYLNHHQALQARMGEQLQNIMSGAVRMEG